jgi:hypothetical protein
MRLLEDLTSRDPKRIWEASCAVRKLRDRSELAHLVEHLDRIKRATKGVKLGGMLRPNSSHLDFAIRKLELTGTSDDCLCSLYPLDDMFDPTGEEEAGNITITATVLTDGNWVDHYDCVCTLCGARFRVDEREYHYTWWAWRKES